MGPTLTLRTTSMQSVTRPVFPSYRNVRMVRMGNISRASVKEDRGPEPIFILDDTLAGKYDFPIF